MCFTSDDDYQNILVFVPMLNSLTWDNSKKVTSWISTGVLPKNIKPFDANLGPTMTNLANGKVILKFNNSLLVQKNSSLYSNFIFNFYIVYELNNWFRNLSNNFVLKSCLLGTVKLTRNSDESKFIYNSWGIAFDGVDSWSFGNNFARNFVTFGVDNTSSSHANSQTNNFLVLDEGPTYEING